MATVKERIILGIDPGTNIMGYGIIRVIGTRPELITLGVLRLKRDDDHSLRLKQIFEYTLGLIDQHLPDDLAIEAPFFGKNVQSMLKLGRAQGVAMAAGLYRQVPITEYSPKRVKQSITGHGNASKEQVAAMLKTLLSLNETHAYLDATDAVAVALCHHFQSGNNSAGAARAHSGWKSFLTANPDRIVSK